MKRKDEFEVMKRFIIHFGYAPKSPNTIGYDTLEFAELMEKCIMDNTDYTIEKYGTIPKERGCSDILID